MKINEKFDSKMRSAKIGQNFYFLTISASGGFPLTRSAPGLPVPLPVIGRGPSYVPLTFKPLLRSHIVYRQSVQ